MAFLDIEQASQGWYPAGEWQHQWHSKGDAGGAMYVHRRRRRSRDPVSRCTSYAMYDTTLWFRGLDRIVWRIVWNLSLQQDDVDHVSRPRTIETP